MEWILSWSRPDAIAAFSAAAAALSLIIAGLALWKSFSAVTAAREANKLSKAANNIADDSNDSAIAANNISRESNALAKEAIAKAQHANRINLHVHQKTIHDGFIALYFHMRKFMHKADIDEVSKFYYHSRTASFYFSEEVAKKIIEFTDACSDLIILQSRIVERRVTENYDELGSVLPESTHRYPNEDQSVESLRAKQRQAEDIVIGLGTEISETLVAELTLVLE